MSIKDQYNQAADAADSFTQKLQGELKRVLENAKDVKKTFKEMADQVTDKQFKMINGQLDKTIEMSTKIKDIESLRGTAAYKSARDQFGMDQKLAALAQKRLDLRKSGLDVNSEAYKLAEQNLDNEEQMLEATKEKWKFDDMTEEAQKKMEGHLIGMNGSMMGLVAGAKAFLATIIANPIAIILTVVVGLLATFLSNLVFILSSLDFCLFRVLCLFLFLPDFTRPVFSSILPFCVFLTISTFFLILVVTLAFLLSTLVLFFPDNL